MLAQHSLEAITANPAYTKLLLTLKLFVKLTEGYALIGQDLLRVRLSRQQEQDMEIDDMAMDDASCSDALDLACQIMDVVGQGSAPLVELLGACQARHCGVAWCQ